VLKYRALPLRYTDINMYIEFYVYTYIVEHKSESRIYFYKGNL